MYRVIECYWVIKLPLLMNGKGEFYQIAKWCDRVADLSEYLWLNCRINYDRVQINEELNGPSVTKSACMLNSFIFFIAKDETRKFNIFDNDISSFIYEQREREREIIADERK